MSSPYRLEGKVADKANLILPSVAKLLQKHDIAFCLDGGTLLGIVREGRLLPWDYDLDLFVRGEDASKIRALKWQLLRLGFRLNKRKTLSSFGPIPNDAPRVYKIKSLRKYDGQRLTIDLIFKYADEGHYHWVVGINPPVHKKVPRKFYDQFGSIEYKGYAYPIPHQVDEYLKYRYGDWRTPKKEWNFKVDDNAIS